MSNDLSKRTKAELIKMVEETQRGASLGYDEVAALKRQLNEQRAADEERLRVMGEQAKMLAQHEKELEKADNAAKYWQDREYEANVKSDNLERCLEGLRADLAAARGKLETEKELAKRTQAAVQVLLFPEHAEQVLPKNNPFAVSQSFEYKTKE